LNCHPSKLINKWPNWSQVISTIDDQQGETTIVGLVPFHPAPHDAFISNVDAMIGVFLDV
jgi:hypothetical protein